MQQESAWGVPFGTVLEWVVVLPNEGRVVAELELGETEFTLEGDRRLIATVADEIAAAMQKFFTVGPVYIAGPNPSGLYMLIVGVKPLENNHP